MLLAMSNGVCPINSTGDSAPVVKSEDALVNNRQVDGQVSAARGKAQVIFYFVLSY